MPDPIRKSPQVLIVADVWCSTDALCDELRRHASNAARVLVVAPALASRVHSWANDTDRESSIARSRLEDILARLQHHGVRAEGRLADESTQDPALVVRDALNEFAATEVILVTEDHEHANWAEQDFASRIAQPDLPVTRLTVAHDQSL